MLQQNNNNNYPCLSVSGSTPEMLQKCSRASLPFPSRLELGLGDLPLIRGLRAWALCSKNRRKPGGLLGGGQAPTAPTASRRGSASCPRPADVHLSREWGRMGYGLPLGLDARQAGIGALVTVATLKTSEGSGKTQTQCLFLRTEKGSCLYSTAKPGSGVTSSAASSVVGGWLRGKAGGSGGSRDTPAGRRDQGPTAPAQTGANRVRVRSGRRWRKSCNSAGREKSAMSRERQQRSREHHAGEIALEERQEEQDKGGLDSKQFPSPQQDIRRARQEKEEAFRSPRCSHNAPPKTCTQCGRKAQRRLSQDEHEGDESPKKGVPNRLNSEVKGMKKESQKNEEEENRGLCRSESSYPVLVESQRSCDVEENKEAETNNELKMRTSHSMDDCSEKSEDTNSDSINDSTDGHFEQVTKDFTSRHNRDFNDRKQSDNRCEELAANVNGLSDHVEEQEEVVDVEEEEGSISQAPAEFSVVSVCCGDISASTCTADSPEPSTPLGGSTCKTDHGSCGKEDHFDGDQQGITDCENMGKEELDVRRVAQQEQNLVVDENITVNENSSKLEERDASSSPLRNGYFSIYETEVRILTENGCNCNTTELHRAENRGEESQDQTIEQRRVNPEEWAQTGRILKKESTCAELDDADGNRDDRERHSGDDINDSTIPEDDNKEVTGNCALKDKWKFQESAVGCRGWEEKVGDTCGNTSITLVGTNGETSTDVTNVACADPSTSLALSLANPAPSLPPLGAMATGLPCLEAEREAEEEEDGEEEGVGVTASDGEGGQEGTRRKGRELEEQGKEERGSTVATEEGRKEEEEEEEDEFGVFMQAEGEPAWSEGSTMSASVPCGSRGSVGESHGC